jgi:hypothetical protein
MRVAFSIEANAFSPPIRRELFFRDGTHDLQMIITFLAPWMSYEGQGSPCCEHLQGTNAGKPSSQNPRAIHDHPKNDGSYANVGKDFFYNPSAI